MRKRQNKQRRSSTKGPRGRKPDVPTVPGVRPGSAKSVAKSAAKSAAKPAAAAAPGASHTTQPRTIEQDASGAHVGLHGLQRTGVIQSAKGTRGSMDNGATAPARVVKPRAKQQTAKLPQRVAESPPASSPPTKETTPEALADVPAGKEVDACPLVAAGLENDEWTCRKCTMLNPPDAVQCTACFAHHRTNADKDADVHYKEQARQLLEHRDGAIGMTVRCTYYADESEVRDVKVLKIDDRSFMQPRIYLQFPQYGSDPELDEWINLDSHRLTVDMAQLRDRGGTARSPRKRKKAAPAATKPLDSDDTSVCCRLSFVAWMHLTHTPCPTRTQFLCLPPLAFFAGSAWYGRGLGCYCAVAVSCAVVCPCLCVIVGSLARMFVPASRVLKRASC